MNKFFLIFVGILSVFSCSKPSEKSKQVQFGEICEVPFTGVHLNDEFWAPRMEVNRTVSIPSAFYQCEINGRFDNFALAGGLIEGEHMGDFSFDDTDPYKIIEGASYSLAVKYDPELDAYMDSVITLIVAAQEDDGYLTTCVTNNCTRLSGWWGSSRWERINSHELYNSGHLYEAAVAHYKATGKRTLLDVAIKNADLVCDVFGLGDGQIKYPSGHPIIEMALVKLYHVTGDKKYLDRARYFVDEAGRLSNGRKPSIYSQDHKPVLEQDEIVGHAVRAGYFYSGVTDVASLQHDRQLFDAVDRVWENMAGKKLYINGGIGSRAQGEGFGPDYELNNFNNYCETCASIANVYWNQRMFLATGDSKYIDVLERTLYNGVISGVSLSGDRFFYDNPLASHGGHERQKWFGCACCPGNITRFMASVPGYVYATHRNNAVYVNLFVAGNAKITLEKGEIELEQMTKYPWEGNVDIKVNKSVPGKFAMHIRIPGWARNQPVPTNLYKYADGKNPGVSIAINGKPVKVKPVDGYVVLDRQWQQGDKVSLRMDMPVRRTQAHEKATYNEGLLAMERGPILYALESIDQPEDFLFNIVIPRDAEISSRFDKTLLNGVVVLEGGAFAVNRDPVSGQLREEPFTFKAIPYHTWNNRGKGQLVVWTPEKAEYAVLKPEPTIASLAQPIGGWGYNDQFEPKSSSDLNTPYHYWWLKQGGQESAGYKFSRSETISSVEVYWLAFDHYDVSYRAPESWKLFYRVGDEWKEVVNTSPYGVETDMYNKVTFNPVTTGEIKLVAQLRRDKEGLPGEEDFNGYSGGIIEWKVNKSATIGIKGGSDGPPGFSVSDPGTMDQVGPVPPGLGINTFYKKYLNAGGISIVSSENVSDEAFIRAQGIITVMLSKRPDVKRAMVEKGCKVMIIGRNEDVCDLPEYAHICDTPENIGYWNKRARGFGGAPEDAFSASFGEENILCLEGDRYKGENILVHEFAHLIHTVGIVGVRPDFDSELETLLQHAVEKGRWKNTYAITNKEEYFAEAAQSFFDCNRYSENPNGVHNAINTREKLKTYDPEMYDLLLRYFPESEIDVCDGTKI